MKNSIDFIHPLLSIYQSLQLPFVLVDRPFSNTAKSLFSHPRENPGN